MRGKSVTYLREEVVVDLHATIGEQLGEMDRGTDEEVVANHVRDHFLVNVPVVHLLPIRVLKQKYFSLVNEGNYFSAEGVEFLEIKRNYII